MPRRPGGLDPAEIDAALAALNDVTSPQALEEAINRVPALSTPMLHAILRQQYLELSNRKDPRLSYFAPRYWGLFLLLHERWHRELVSGIRADYERSAA